MSGVLVASSLFSLSLLLLSLSLSLSLLLLLLLLLAVDDVVDPVIIIIWRCRCGWVDLCIVSTVRIIGVTIRVGRMNGRPRPGTLLLWGM